MESAKSSQPSHLSPAYRDFFICHAEEDKVEVARPIYDTLTNRGFSVWLDEVELTIGDSLRQSIDHGLANCRFGIVVLSKAFFSKNWPQYELDGLMTRQMSGRKTILPVWHSIERDEIATKSPSLAGLLGVTTTQGLSPVVEQIIRAYVLANAPSDSPMRLGDAAGTGQEQSWPAALAFPLTDIARTRLLRDWPDCWEYILFGDALARGLREHEPAWRDHQLRLVRSTGQHVVEAELGPYIERAFEDLAGIVGNAERLLAASTQQVAFGAPGESGDPTAIEHLCQRLMAIYGQCLEWAAEIRSTRRPEPFDNLLEIVASFVDRPIGQFRAFVDQSMTELVRIPELLVDPDGDPVKISLDLTLTIDDNVQSAFDRELQRLLKSRRRPR